MPIHVAIVEDQKELREGLQFMIGHSPGFQCDRIFDSAEAVLSADLSKVDVALLDIGLPGMSGIECIAKLKAKYPDLEILMLTIFEEDDKIFESIKAGASGYLVKNLPPVKILEAIDNVHRGGAPMTDGVARRIVEHLRDPNKERAEKFNLSAREAEILEQLSKGKLYKEIADRLEISAHTVRTHVHNIYKKLHVQNRTEALNAYQGRR